MTSSNTLEVANVAFQKFSQGLAMGERSPFLDCLSEDFSFWFPAGPFKGDNVGKEKAKAFFLSVSQIFPTGLHLTLQRTMHCDHTVLFEVRSHDTMLGHPYENQAAISFDINGDRVCGYREYLGVIFQLADQIAIDFK